MLKGICLNSNMWSLFCILCFSTSLKPEISVKNQEIVLSFVKEGRKKVIDPGEYT